jgi:DNA-binding GntR family transcriptional regulator
MRHPPSQSHDAFPHPTKHQFVYARLREAIITCELGPNDRLRIEELAHRFDVSIIPVREALRVLQSEGLVVTVPHVGTAVAPIDIGSITEALTIMEGLEIVSTRIAAERAPAAALDVLAGQVAAMDEAVAAGRAGDWAGLNRQFHLTIAAQASMPLLDDMLARAFDRWERVWHYYFHGALTRRVAQAQAEHHDLLRQLRARDLPAIEETIRNHNRAALAAYLLHHTGAKS